MKTMKITKAQHYGIMKLALEHLTQYGCMHDCNPTRMQFPHRADPYDTSPAGRAWAEAEVEWNEELNFRIQWAYEMDRTVRKFAHAALLGLDQAQHAAITLAEMAKPVKRSARKKK